jgi:hypothetical protein
MCPKGSLMVKVTNDPERVTTPLRGDRKGGFVPVSWDEALDDIANRVKALIADTGLIRSPTIPATPLVSAWRGTCGRRRFIDGIGSKVSYSAAPQVTSSRYDVELRRVICSTDVIVKSPLSSMTAHYVLSAVGSEQRWAARVRGQGWPPGHRAAVCLDLGVGHPMIRWIDHGRLRSRCDSAAAAAHPAISVS